MKRQTRLSAGLVAVLLQATTVQAQITPYVVVEGGLERRQVLPDEQASSTVSDLSEKQRKEGFAYGLALGAETPLSATLFIGGELGVSRSTVDTEAVQFRGIEVVESVLVGVVERTTVDPRWSYSVTGRLGVNLSRSVALYGLAGLGGERVRTELTSETDFGGASDTVLRTKRSYDGVTFGGGARLFLSDRAGVRLEYRRLETDDGYDPERLMAGLLYRL